MTLEEIYGNAKALVEDKTYQIGEISEKTGLQKTANGWVKPKSNKGAKKDASGADVLNNKHYKDDVRTAEGEAKIVSQMDTKVIQKRIDELETLKKQNGGKLGISGEKELKIKKAELEKRNGSGPKGDVDRFVKNNKSMWQKNIEKAPDARLKELAAKSEKGNAAEKEVAKMAKEELAKRNKENGPKENGVEKKTSSKSLKLPDEKSSFQTDVNRMKKLKKEDYKQYTIQLEKLHSKYPINKWKDLYNKTANDSACRITADTKIKLSKIKK